MAKTLKATVNELEALFGFSNSVPPEKDSDAARSASFRRAIKIALKPYNDGIQDFLTVIQEDAKRFQQDKTKKEGELKEAKKEEKKKLEKEIADLRKALDDIEKDFQERLKKYREEHKGSVEVKFDNEVYLYITNLFSTCAKDIFDKNADKTKITFAMWTDSLFELMDKAT